jgi:adenylate cyclase
MNLEIERKYLLTEDPRQLLANGVITFLHEQRIEQTYTAMDKDEELRVRRIVNVETKEVSYTHTFKRGVGLAREEVEYEINETLYTQIMDAFGYIPLTKNRITAKYNDITVEIDIYDQVNFTVVEVEFNSMEEADSFVPPTWFGEEISFNKTYSNKAVWKQLQQK